MIKYLFVAVTFDVHTRKISDWIEDDKIIKTFPFKEFNRHQIIRYFGKKDWILGPDEKIKSVTPELPDLIFSATLWKTSLNKT